MKTKDIKKQLILESKNFVPDIKDKIYKSVGYFENKRANVSFRLKPAIAFLVLLILMVSLFIKPQNLTNTFVIIQINPEIELEVDVNNNIVEVNPLNTDGYFFIESLNLSNLKLSEGIDKLLQEAIDKGFLQSEESKITAYALNSNIKIENNVNELIKQVIESKRPNSINNIEDLKEEAIKYNVSVGKMHIIKKTILVDSSIEIEEALKMQISELVKIINSVVKEKVDKFESEYKENLKKLDDEYKNDLMLINNRKIIVKNEIKNIESLVLNNVGYFVVINKIKVELTEYKLNTNITYNLSELIIDIKEFYNDYFDFIEEMLRENHKNQKDEYKNKVNENVKSDREDFSLEIHNDILEGIYNNRYTKEEKEVIKIVNRISVMLNNKYPGANKKIEELYDLYLEKINDLSSDFKNSVFIITFEEKYLNFINNMK